MLLPIQHKVVWDNSTLIYIIYVNFPLTVKLKDLTSLTKCNTTILTGTTAIKFHI